MRIHRVYIEVQDPLRRDVLVVPLHALEISLAVRFEDRAQTTHHGLLDVFVDVQVGDEPERPATLLRDTPKRGIPSSGRERGVQGRVQAVRLKEVLSE